eukprot:s695_g16.t1
MRIARFARNMPADAGLPIAEWALPVLAGTECALSDDDFDGRVVDVPVRSGDVYCLSGAARYQWTHEISPDSICNGRRRVTERYSMAGLKRAVLSRGRQALHSLERALGPSSIGMLAGVVLLSALHMLCKACSAPAARDKAILLEADGYRPVPLQAEDD